MEPRRAGALALGFSLAGVVLVVLIRGVAAGVGPSGLYHGHPHDSIFHAPRPTATSSSAAAGGPSTTEPVPHRGGGDDRAIGTTIGVIIQVLFLVWLLSLAWRGTRWLREEMASRRRNELAPLVVDFDVLEDPEPLVEEIRLDFDAQLDLLLSGAPRNAIVACWERFEEQAERVGLARKPWETSSEFTLRLLDAVSADDSAVGDLAVLYREARFSDHEITEHSRQRAVEDLGRIRDSIAARPGAGR
jgi:hypothetical protein